MDFGLVAAAFLIATGKPPLDTALTRTEPPTSLRAAFTVELTDGEAFREVRFDPRIKDASERWVILSGAGQSAELDRAVESWGAEPAPDGWPIPDDLRASMGSIVEATDMGELWRIEFEHQPSENDGPLDIWASDHLVGYSWLEPVTQQLVRVEYEAMEPFQGPNGSRIESYEHSYTMAQDATYGLTFVAAYSVDIQGRFLSETMSRSYRARITDVEFFFANETEEAAYFARQKKTAAISTDQFAFVR